MNRNMREETTGPLYNLWAKFYDHTFGSIVTRRRFRAFEQLQLKPGDRVLDLGVGTGLVLPHFPRDVTVVGMDLSEGMLAKATRRCQTHDLKHCHLVQGDAMFPPFAEQSFDHVLICHTISVVSNPARLLEWAGRLVKPGGTIILLNHFQSTQPLVGWLEHILNPIFLKIGWRSDLPLEDVLRPNNLHVQYHFKMRVWDLWQIVVLTPARAGKPATTTSSPTADPQQLPDAAPDAGLLALDGTA